MGVKADAPIGVVSPTGVRVMNGTVRGMGGHGLRMMGDGTVVERVYSTNNAGPGIVVGAGSVIDSVATLNGSGAAIIGSIVRGSTASNNAVGIFIRPGGVAMGNIATYNGGNGIYVSTGTATGNTSTYNGGFGIDVVCPSSIVGNTAVANQSGGIRTNGICALADNAQ
jgi:hypothetical protein